MTSDEYRQSGMFKIPEVAAVHDELRLTKIGYARMRALALEWLNAVTLDEHRENFERAYAADIGSTPEDIARGRRGVLYGSPYAITAWKAYQWAIEDAKQAGIAKQAAKIEALKAAFAEGYEMAVIDASEDITRDATAMEDSWFHSSTLTNWEIANGINPTSTEGGAS